MRTLSFQNNEDDLILLSGTVRSGGFPLMMDSIYAPVVLEDVNADGYLGMLLN